MAKEPLYPHVPGGKQPYAPKASVAFRNAISLQIKEEDDGIKAYDVLVAQARNVGLTEIAKKLAVIDNQERQHKQTLIEISDELFG